MKNSAVSTLLLVSLLVLFSCEESMNFETTTNSGLDQISADVTDDVTLITNYTFTGLEGDPIPLETAKRWTSKYRDTNPGKTEAHFFGFEILKQILAEDGCVGIRMYYAIDDEGNKQIVLVGVNANGENLIPSSLLLDGDDDNIVADASYPCPSFCPPGTGL